MVRVLHVRRGSVVGIFFGSTTPFLIAVVSMTESNSTNVQCGNAEPVGPVAADV